MSASELQGPKSTFRRILRLAVTVFLNLALLVQLLVFALGTSTPHLFFIEAPNFKTSGTFDAKATILIVGGAASKWNIAIVRTPIHLEDTDNYSIEWDELYNDPTGTSFLRSCLYAFVDEHFILAVRHASVLALLIFLTAFHHRRLFVRLFRRRTDPEVLIH